MRLDDEKPSTHIQDKRTKPTTVKVDKGKYDYFSTEAVYEDMVKQATRVYFEAMVIARSDEERSCAKQRYKSGLKKLGEIYEDVKNGQAKET